MRLRMGLRGRLLASHVFAIVVGMITLVGAFLVVAPSAFEAAMGHAGDGGGMSAMMSTVVRRAFDDALRTAAVLAGAIAVTTAIAIGIALSARLRRPIRDLAVASGRIAAGRYAERVPVAGSDEIAELARSFNRMAASLEAIEQRRLRLVGDVAHELRTPLATLDGYVEGLQDRVISPDDATWALLRRETRRLTRLVDELQDLWRAEARDLPLSPAVVDLADELRAVAVRFEERANGRGVEFRLAPAGAPLAVRADRERLAQVLDNLVSNAVRYASPGTSITLLARPGASEVLVGVADEGPGLTAEQRELVFERFYRIDPSRSRALGGAGIGLAIVRALTEAMGGRVWAESDGPGRGATFWAAFPRA